MTGSNFHDLAEILREAALQEAANRTKQRSQLIASVTAAGSDQLELDAQSEAKADELLAVYEDEKAKNDALAKSLDKRLEELARTGAGRTDGKTDDDQRRLELEWQQLDFAISALEKENKQAPALESATVLDVRTRSELHDLNTQYASALDMLKAELGAEREALAREKQLRADLDVVQVGLTRRLAQLQRKRTQDLTSESALRDLSRKFRREEHVFKELLAQLIDMGSALFGADNRKVVTLRHYLDEFMNQAWDHPLDPWVSASKLALRRTGGEVDDAIIELFLRANIVVAHPKDARRWRLVAFHKPTRSSS
ncbi:uncharacterized protein PAN0_004c2449 [Moesziomyces antarcticus]|uniref:Uncharacterized protein n=2 Tax=Pseudozyma antarctica TaxID=84753 RepID=A0A5C3FJH8_PSEA2|nr:uncharacterized protein PAN0_004c2449 [Moesziomyces antarcticus]GAK64239.1 conserved hypothetical protein [Moesziomyces antarcticus]SPO44533.1 uncharacterized protein PSANT_02218 [Moesziomyces antarcticus]